MLLLPVDVTAREAGDTARLLAQAMKDETGITLVVDATNLQHFDSSALAVLLDSRRAAEALGKSFALRNAPAKFEALAALYGVSELLSAPATKAIGVTTTH